MLTIGSRGSQLALWQARFIASKLAATGVETRIEIIKTTGDHLQTASLAQAGGKGLFTKEIEDALLAEQIDLAVHSLKDLPTELPPGLSIAAIPERENPLDAIAGAKLADLAPGARVGTSSPRRAAQLRMLRADLEIEPIRGNVDTRLNKLRGGQYDAILLAAAGLRRLGLESEIAQLFSARQICPAPGQGALAIETRNTGEPLEICRRLHHEITSLSVGAERATLAGLGGGCQLPMGAYACLDDKELFLCAVVVAPDGAASVRAEMRGDPASAVELGQKAAAELLRRGAAKLMAAGA